MMADGRVQGRVPDPAPWAARNQQWLMRRLAQFRARLEAWPTEVDPAALPRPLRRAAASRSGFEPALWTLGRRFGLSPFEQDTLLLVAGYELDQSLRRALARHAGTGPGRPSFSLAMALLPQAHWDALAPQAPLRHWQLLQLAADRPLAEAALSVDERVLHALTGVAAFDTRLAGLARPWPAAEGSSAWADTPALQPDLQRARRALAAGQPPALLLLHEAALGLSGTPGTAGAAGLAQAARWLQACGLAAVHVRTGDLPEAPAERAALARLLDREALLHDAAVLLEATPETVGGGPALAGARLAAWLNELRSPVLLLGSAGRELLAALHRHQPLVLAPHTPPAPLALAGRPADDPALRRARAQFQLSDAQVAQALAGLAAPAPTPLTGDPTDLPGDAPPPAEATLPEPRDCPVWAALRQTARGGLDTLARRIDATTQLDDLVLPKAQTQQLLEIVRHLQQRERVLSEWGFGRASSRGLGLCALFAGESGTGKTLAAEAIAQAAGLDLYAIDLAGVVSKYIGETEKNLARVFDAAEASGAVLLFDEADALFGKRSEVKDSHDRYANIEVAYLLQRVESYRGLAVLTTNLKGALDRAFLRRIRFVVQFPFPDAAARAAIWQRQWPEGAPVDKLDVAALAGLNLSGGNIRSVALNAAFRAADAGGRITQARVLEAAHAELAKLVRPLPGLPAGSPR